MYKRDNCSSLLFSAQKNTEQFQKARKEFESLPLEASDTSLKPVTPAAIAERQKALQLQEKMTNLSKETENLLEGYEKCTFLFDR